MINYIDSIIFELMEENIMVDSNTSKLLLEKDIFQLINKVKKIKMLIAL
jgi:hypothetical protein